MMFSRLLNGVIPPNSIDAERLHRATVGTFSFELMFG